MLNLTCYIIDDETHAVELLSRFINKTPGLTLLGTTTKGLEALPVYSQAEPPQLTFLDIQMPQVNGLDLANLIKARTRIIFTTSFREFAPEAFDQQALDYLLKPIAYERFLAAVQKARQQTAQPKSDNAYCYVRSGNAITRLELQQISHITALANYVEIHQTNHSKIITYIGISELNKELPEEQFSRIHRSVIIHHTAIQRIENDEVTLQNGQQFTIGRSYREAFYNKLRKRLLRP